MKIKFIDHGLRIAIAADGAVAVVDNPTVEVFENFAEMRAAGEIEKHSTKIDGETVTWWSRRRV